MTDIAHGTQVELDDTPRSTLERVSDWVRANLFNSVLNSVLTLLIAAGIVWFVFPLLRWAIFNSTLMAESDRACQATGGACWAFLGKWGAFLLFGRFPAEERWRPALVLVLFAAMLFMSARRGTGGRTLFAMWVGGLIVIFALMWGGFLGMPYVENGRWGGLILTLLLFTFGVAFAFPLAILLALARRDGLPALRALAVGYIELIRGVPLITLLFMASVMFPLFLPAGVSVDKLWRAEVALMLFFGAYLAEAIRGGLQVIPRGQYEAADALGLGYWRKMFLVILPQALTISIPSIVNIAIGAFKDTVLITIVGIFDLLGDVNNAMNDPNWRHAYWEAYSFAGAIFFAVCFYMSRYSQRLERSLSRARPGGRRR